MVCATSLRYALFGPMSISGKEELGTRAVLHLHGHLVEASGRNSVTSDTSTSLKS